MGKYIKAIDDLFEQHKSKVYGAAALIVFVNILFAIPFTWNYLHTGLFRDYMVFGSPLKAYSFIQFAWLGIKWLSFMDIFVFLPVIIWSMIMPGVVAAAKAQQEEK